MSSNLDEVFLKALQPNIHDVIQLTPKIFEIIVEAPLAAKTFKPGQFFKLQNYERVNGFCFEPLALTGAMVEGDRISLVVLVCGVSSYLATQLKPKDPVVLMGPSGQPTKIPNHQNVLLIGGGVGNAALFPIAKAMKEQKCHITYFAGYKRIEDRFKKNVIEEFSDTVIWVCDEDPGFLPTRDVDSSFVGNMIDALESYKNNLQSIDLLLVVGSNRLMEALSNYKGIAAKCRIASINSPMQCMMKGLCAQCLQRHNDNTIVYSCVNQDQCLDHVDFSSLSNRLNQNRLMETLGFFDKTQGISIQN